jgi:hypothetical protein
VVWEVLMMKMPGGRKIVSLETAMSR